MEQARNKADQLKEEAREEGKQSGQAEAEKILAEAEKETKQMLETARNWAQEYRDKHHEKIEKAVSWATRVVLGLEDEGLEHGS